jgi:hypothetical protein
MAKGIVSSDIASSYSTELCGVPIRRFCGNRAEMDEDQEIDEINFIVSRRRSKRTRSKNI